MLLCGIITRRGVRVPASAQDARLHGVASDFSDRGVRVWLRPKTRACAVADDSALWRARSGLGPGRAPARSLMIVSCDQFMGIPLLREGVGTALLECRARERSRVLSASALASALALRSQRTI